MQVTATLTNYTGFDATSAEVGPVEPEVLTAPTPSISGTPQVGKTLTALDGSWPAGATVTNTWSASGSSSELGTGKTLTLTDAQYGKTITLTVAGTKPGHATVRKSVTTAAVAAGTLNGPTPTISGTAKVGVKLTAKAGTWTSGLTLNYAWYASGSTKVIGTGTSFTPTAGQQKGRATP